MINNFYTHKVDSIGEAIKTKDAILIYLSSYSQDLNPIYITFPKLNNHLEKL
ncbi:MAG: hypothetical protein ACTXOO_02870 [Sodalis sp. (in: enterobacteria)]